MTKSLMMLGLRGVGKTVLLNRIQQMADDAGCVTGFIEAEGRQALPDLLTPHLWRILLKLDTQKRARESVHRAFRLLRGFASAFSVQFGGIEVGIKPETATGDLSLDVTDLLVAVGEAAAQRGSPVVILIDEVQYLSGDELSAIMIALHRVSQKQLPLLLFGAGLPQLAALAGEAKSYAERLFFFNEISRLSNDAARTAIMEPLRQENVGIEDDAVEAILAETDCYPFFLQLWGYYAWENAEASPITVDDVSAATERSVEDLDQGFFNIRYQRLTNRQRNYVFALARLGPDPASSTAVAEELGVSVERAAPSSLKKPVVPHLESVSTGAALLVPWQQDPLPVKFLEPVEQHRTVVLVEDTLPEPSLVQPLEDDGSDVLPASIVLRLPYA